MEKITVGDLVEACGGRLLCGKKEAFLSHIRLDSREVKVGDVFVPLIGARQDAHRFLPQGQY